MCRPAYCCQDCQVPGALPRHSPHFKPQALRHCRTTRDPPLPVMFNTLSVTSQARKFRPCLFTADSRRTHISPAITSHGYRSSTLRPQRRSSPFFQRWKGAAPQPFRLRLAISKVSLDRPGASRRRCSWARISACRPAS